MDEFRFVPDVCQIFSSGVPNLQFFFIACRTQVLENLVLSSDLSQTDLTPSQMQRLGKLLLVQCQFAFFDFGTGKLILR